MVGYGRKVYGREGYGWEGYGRVDSPLSTADDRVDFGRCRVW